MLPFITKLWEPDRIFSIAEIVNWVFSIKTDISFTWCPSSDAVWTNTSCFPDPAEIKLSQWSFWIIILTLTYFSLPMFSKTSVGKLSCPTEVKRAPFMDFTGHGLRKSRSTNFSPHPPLYHPSWATTGSVKWTTLRRRILINLLGHLHSVPLDFRRNKVFLLHLGFDCMGLIQLLKDKSVQGKKNEEKKSSLLFEWLLYSDNEVELS